MDIWDKLAYAFTTYIMPPLAFMGAVTIWVFLVLLYTQDRTQDGWVQFAPAETIYYRQMPDDATVCWATKATPNSIPDPMGCTK